MLDIKLYRENPDLIKKDLKNRGEKDKIKLVEAIIKYDEKFRKNLFNIQKLRHSRNLISGEINKVKKENGDIKAILKKAKEIPEKIKKIEDANEKIFSDMKNFRMQIPNILHKSVPAGDKGNKVIRKVGKTQKVDMKSHGEWLEDNNQTDFKRAANLSGTGFYILKDKVAMLDFALQKYAIDKLVKKGYILINPPFLMRREPYEGVVDLADFENVMYKIEGEDLYLIATSEHPMGGMHMGETLESLPIKYVGVSQCFRKEIGSHGIDTRGLFRVHQFSKVEMFVYSRPGDSWKIHEELLAIAEEIYTELEIPYRVVNICSEDIGNIAAKKYDIEAWMPREKKYREIVSCSNCTSYQAVRLGIRFKETDKKDYVHTLNSTAIATSRTIRAIIENNFDGGKVTIPKVLVPYMNGVKEI